MTLGIIGLGDMGKAFATLYAKKGFTVLGTDRKENIDGIRKELEASSVQVVADVERVCLQADFLLFCVESIFIEQVTKEVAPHIKPRTIVGAQTSIKAPEIAAFDKYLNPAVPIITIHSLHGPHVSPKGQTLLIIPYRCTENEKLKAEDFYSETESKLTWLDSHQEHDRMMADVQVVTHIGFESIGTSFMHRGIYPWENPLHSNGLDNLKMLLTLRIYSYKYHVYAGLAMLNPYAEADVRAYAEVENHLFGLMISNNEKEFRELIYQAKERIFGNISSPLMLNDTVMKNYSLMPEADHKANSHLSLLAMVVTWAKLGSNPYSNLVCQTPPFKLRVGMAEYLFRNDSLLDESIDAALHDYSIRMDDLAFHTSVQEWAHIVESKDIEAYKRHFLRTKQFLGNRLDAGRKVSSLLIERLNQNE